MWPSSSRLLQQRGLFANRHKVASDGDSGAASGGAGAGAGAPASGRGRSLLAGARVVGHLDVRVRGLGLEEAGAFGFGVARCKSIREDRRKMSTPTIDARTQVALRLRA